MNKLTLKFALLAVIFIFSSCSNDDDVAGEKDPAMGTLSFGAMLNGIDENRSSHLNGIPDCSQEAPAYAEVVMSGTTNVGTAAAPEVITFTPTPADNDGDGEDEYFTDAILDLEAGIYTLESFNVYDANDNLIWVAPETNGSFSEFVTNPLPLSITVEADMENYTVVDVLCFDNRVLEAYGDLVFGLNENKALEFCFSAEYCPENGVNPASVSVNIWLGNDANGTVLYSGVMNDLSSPDGEAVCFALPDLTQYTDDQKYLYYEVTIQDHLDTYGDVEQAVISGTLSRADIQANFVGATQINAQELIFACDEGGVTEPDPVSYGFNYTFDEGAEGWQNSWNQQNTIEVSNSLLNITAAETYAHIMNTAVSVNVDSYPYVAVRVPEIPASASLTMGIYNDGQTGGVAGDYSFTPTLNGDVYLFDLSIPELSAGTELPIIMYLKFDNVAVGDNINIDWIRSYATLEDFQAENSML